MNLGTYPITELFLGDSPIKSIWLGTTQVWQKSSEYTYEIDNVSVEYFPTGTSTILPTGDNYASVVGRYRTYINGVLESTLPTVKLNVSPGLNYIINSNNNLYFNVDEYGTTDMSSFNNPLTIAVDTSCSGTTGPTVYVKVTPNLVASSAVTSTICKAVVNKGFLTYNETTFTVNNKNTSEIKTTYTSGKNTTSTRGVDGYLFKINSSTSTSTLVNTLGSNGSTSVNVGSTNTYSYPKVHLYRLSSINGTTGNDDFIYMMQKSSTNTTGLHVYYGTQKVNNMDIETSTLFYLANNGHTSSSTYTYTCTDQGVNITEINGVFLIEATSSSSGSVTITDNNGNTCSFTININLN